MKAQDPERVKQLQQDADTIAKELGPLTKKRQGIEQLEFLQKLRKWAVLRRLLDRLS